ncbi:MAG TPA: GIY-YIG nuclease family protein [candidate division Zixibacteria bacterium]|nr:GIY-YIG nuclease family protein [candidate division Zixibacteria bacterium]
MKTYFVYIMASKKNGTLYIGVTSNLQHRVWQHKNNVHEGFTKKYSVHRLVWYEMTNQIEGAMRREKQMKKWRRLKWKIDLIEENNPNWDDIYDELFYG